MYIKYVYAYVSVTFVFITKVFGIKKILKIYTDAIKSFWNHEKLLAIFQINLLYILTNLYAKSFWQREMGVV